MFPEFNGSVAYGWIITVEQYCEAKGISEEKKFSEAEKALARDALFWWYSWKKRNQRAKWWDFVIALLREFEPESELYLPDPVADSEEEEIPGQEEIQKDDARKAKEENREIRRNWCEDWIHSNGYWGDQHEVVPKDDDETATEEKPMVAQLQIGDALEESRRVTTVLTTQVTMGKTNPEGKIELTLPEQTKCGAATAAQTLPTAAEETVDQATPKVQTRALVIERPPPKPPYHGDHCYVRGGAGGKFGATTAWMKDAKDEVAKRRPPPKPPESMDSGVGPAALTPPTAASGSENQATPATRMREKVAEVSRSLKASAWAKWKPYGLGSSPSLMGLAHEVSGCLTFTKLFDKYLLATGNKEKHVLEGENHGVQNISSEIVKMTHAPTSNRFQVEMIFLSLAQLLGHTSGREKVGQAQNIGKEAEACLQAQINEKKKESEAFLQVQLRTGTSNMWVIIMFKLLNPDVGTVMNYQFVDAISLLETPPYDTKMVVDTGRGAKRPPPQPPDRDACIGRDKMEEMKLVFYKIRSASTHVSSSLAIANMQKIPHSPKTLDTMVVSCLWQGKPSYSLEFYQFPETLTHVHKAVTLCRPTISNERELRNWALPGTELHILRWGLEQNWKHCQVIVIYWENLKLQPHELGSLDKTPNQNLNADVGSKGSWVFSFALSFTHWDPGGCSYFSATIGSASVASCWLIVSTGLEFEFQNWDSQVTEFNKIRGREEHIARHQPFGSTLSSFHFCSHGSRGLIFHGDSTTGRVKDLWAHYMFDNGEYCCMLLVSWLEEELVLEMLSTILKALD